VDIFSYDETVQMLALEQLYKEITLIFKQGIIIAKYRECLIVDKLVRNHIELPELDTVEYMSNIRAEEIIQLNFELDGPIDLNKLVMLGVPQSPILMDSSYLVMKQQTEIALEQLLKPLLSRWKASATVSINDYLDEDEILWSITLTIMAGR